MAKKKNEKESPFVPVEEQPYQVPGNWCWTRCRTITDLFNGDRGVNYPSKKDYVQHGIPFINAGTIKDGKIDYSLANYITNDKYESLRAGKIQKNDILYCLRGSLGKTAIIRDECIGAISSSLCILRVKSNINREYFFWLLQSDCIQMQQNNVDNGTAQPNLSASSVLNYSIPLPPMVEQQRIVDRIEGLFAKLDEAKEKAQEALESFELRKSAILNKAFDGSLTSEWRQMHPGVSAEPYLQKLKEMGNGISRQEFDFWNNDELPDTWCESKIGKLLYFAGRIGWKGLKAEEYTEEGPLFLSVYNLNDGDEVTFHHVYHITKERYEESPEIMVQVGDVLLTKDGAGIGKLGYVRNLPQEATINSSLLLIRPDEAALSKYVYYLLLSPKLQDIVKERITGSATPHLFQRDIKEFVIPVPPIEEQTEIVRILDHFFEKENQAKEKVEATLENINTMKKAILAKAFRGDLGTNNPEDESAEELLKRTLS